MQRWLEFHDSDIVSVHPETDALVLALDGYVHQWELLDGGWHGTGWMQPVELRITAPRPAISFVAAPVGISQGGVGATGGQVESLVCLPSSIAGEIVLRLQLIDGTSHHVSGSSFALTATGEPRFVEGLPSDLRPTDETASAV